MAVLAAGWGFAVAQTAPTLLPYTAKLIAGGGATAKFTAGQACPTSGFTALDTYGDGCLATEIALTGPRYAAADLAGNVFFSDYTNGLIRRVDATSGIVNLVAGSIYTSPTQGMACGSGSTVTATDAKGDGCLGVQVNVYHPVGLVFSPAGDLYFAEAGNSDVRKIAATAGLIPSSTVAGATVYTGVITLVDGSSSLSTYGYSSDNATTTINAATQSFLDTPYGVSFDNNGNLFLTEEYRNAVLVVNTNASGTETVNGISVPAGTVAKIVGASTSGGATCPNGSASADKCNFGTYTSGAVANTQETDSPFAVTTDLSGNAYFANTYTRTVGLISTAGTLTNFVGQLNTTGTTLQRGAAGSFAIGTAFSVAADSTADVYVTDPINGVVWRVDGTSGRPMYVVAGGASSVCTSATDANGDGCPATQAKLGLSAAASNPTSQTGVYGVSVDAHADLFLGDTGTNEIREIASGTQFGQVGGNAVTQNLDIHFAQGDSPAAGAYKLTKGSAFFALGTPNCTSNSDTTMDCVLPITVAPVTAANLGAFSGTLQATATSGGVGTFNLSGTYVQTPVTRTALAVTTAGSCTSTVTGVGTQLILTARITATGSATGAVTFYANNLQIGQPQPVTGNAATTTYTPTTAGTYTLTATYSGDSYYRPSTGTSSATVATPSFSMAVLTAPTTGSVVQGQQALYSFTIAQTVYTGTINFTAAGLPPNSTLSFSPSSIAATTGCSTSSIVTMTVGTSLAKVTQAGLSGAGGSWQRSLLLLGVVLAGLLALHRRRLRTSLGRLSLCLLLLLASTGLVACGKSAVTGVSTPVGTYTVTVTGTGSTGTVSTTTVQLAVTANPY